VLASRATPRPGLIGALTQAEINGQRPDDMELLGVTLLLIGGGFDTTTALTAHALEWLSEHPGERDRLSQHRATLLDSATEEFLRYFTPAPGDGRTIAQDCELAGTQFREGDRLWLSWAMANRDPAVFENPNQVDLARSGGWLNRSPCAREPRISRYDAVGSVVGWARAAVCSAHISARACGAIRHRPGKFR
jgi:cytochrome P450